MNLDELLAILKAINGARATPADETLLREIVALVIKNPLPDDRAVCQAQILALVAQRVKEDVRAD